MQTSLQRIYQDITKTIASQIQDTEDLQIMGCETKALTDYFFSLESFFPIEFHPNKKETASKENGFQLPENFHEKDGSFSSKQDYTTESLLISFPIKDNSGIDKIMKFHPFKHFSKDIKWSNTDIKLIIQVKGYGFTKTESEIEIEVNKKKTELMDWISAINIQISNLNEYLISDIRQCLEKRKRAIELNDEKYRNISNRINIPLQQKTDKAIQNIRLDPSPLVKRIKPSPTLIEEYVLDSKKVLDIVHVLDNQGRQFEKTAITYKLLGEEDLRNILLVNLNAIFEGKAVGEAFCNKGKTDIYLNIDRGNILVAECKLWSGKTGYTSAIDQLLSYLTWRNNYGILITFCRRKNFSKILNESMIFIKEHNFLKREVTVVDKSHFISYHNLPSDESKNVEIHHVFYNLFIV